MANETDNEHVMTPEKMELLQANFKSAMPNPAIEKRRMDLIRCWKPSLDKQSPAELHQRAQLLEARAVNGEISLDQYRLGSLEIIREERPKPPAIYGSTRDAGPEILTAAFCRTAGLPDEAMKKQFRPEILEAADRPNLRGVGIQQLILQAAMNNGYDGPPAIRQGNIREVMQAAFDRNGSIRAGFSTHTLSSMLTTTGNKLLLDGFNAIPQTWREVAEIQSVSDFKQFAAYRLTADLEYEELPPAGEIKHGTASQESYTMQAKTYAKMFALTRQDIINDDLGAFDSIRRRLGMGAAVKMNKVFWTAWLAASAAGTFWTEARGNLSASSPLGETGLNAAVKLFRTLAAPDGNMMALEPDRLLIPADLEATGRVLYSSQEMRDTTANTKYPTANLFYNRFRPVIIPELGNSGYPGWSATTFWLLANPAILASAVMVFLDGVQNPTIESADADFGTLGIQFRGYHDFGMAMSEYRASVKATA